MELEDTIIVIDAGNSFIKISQFKNGKISDIEHFVMDELVSNLDKFIPLKNCKGIISSVRSLSDTHILISFFEGLILLNDDLKLPIQLMYETPQSLGKDRICNAVCMWTKNPKKHSVSIDIGTCIKFDVVDGNGNYLGGSISPGITLRYKSMNDYTAQLPLLNETSKTPLIGRSTKSSMHSGVINGIQSEINDLMYRYSLMFDGLTFFVTGGDAKYFDFHPKNNIFAIENLTLEGLYHIFLFNDQ